MLHLPQLLLTSQPPYFTGPPLTSQPPSLYTGPPLWWPTSPPLSPTSPPPLLPTSPTWTSTLTCPLSTPGVRRPGRLQQQQFRSQGGQGRLSDQRQVLRQSARRSSADCHLHCGWRKRLRPRGGVLRRGSVPC